MGRAADRRGVPRVPGMRLDARYAYFLNLETP